MTNIPDIGYAVTTQLKSSGTPSKYHYGLLKQFALYLRDTAHLGIRFKCSTL